MIRLTEEEEYTLLLEGSRMSCMEFVENSHLYEKVFDIEDKDIEILSLPFIQFTELLDSIAINNNKSKLLDIMQVPYRYKHITKSGGLLSPICNEAHKKRPISIYFIPYCNWFYDSALDYISVGYPMVLYDLLKKWYYSNEIFTDFNDVYTSIVPNRPMGSMNRIDQDIIYAKDKKLFTLEEYQTGIYHEISHWIYETLYTTNSNYIKSRHNSSDQGAAKYYKVPNMIFSTVELNAYIHGLLQRKKLMGEDEWNNLTIDDLFEIDPGLNVVMSYAQKDATHKQAFNNFKQQIVSRLNREHMLGTNMK